MVVICDIYDPLTRQPYTRDARYVAKKAEAYLVQTGIAEVSYWGPEAEFFIFDNVRYGGATNEAFYHVDSAEAWWNSGLEGGKGGQIPPKRGYFPVPPTDTKQDVRSRIVLALEEAGVPVEVHHHEVATAGQAEIDMKFEPLLKMGDQFMWYKYIIKNIAKRHGKTVTFMPKPVFEDNGSGMHSHLSLWKDGKPLFAADGYAGLSEIGLHSIGGILKHAPAILAFAAPTTNSYRRLVPGFEAPVNLVMSARNRSAGVRIPMYSDNPKAKRLEFRCPDPTANGYLAWTAMLMAAVDGIQNEIDPGEPLDRDIYEMSAEELAAYPKTPGSLEEAIDALEADHAFLLAGDVFTDDLVAGWIEWKRENELNEMALRPHPYEFHLYYDS
jgi:glutamine synthetase